MPNESVIGTVASRNPHTWLCSTSSRPYLLPIQPQLALTSPPTAPRRKAVVVPKSQDFVAFPHFGRYESRCAVKGDSRSLDLNNILRLNLKVLVLNVPTRPQMHGNGFLVRFHHKVNTIRHSFPECHGINPDHFAPNCLNGFVYSCQSDRLFRSNPTSSSERSDDGVVKLASGRIHASPGSLPSVFSLSLLST